MSRSMKKIVYHHVPKCGGMSIAAGIALSYFPWQTIRYGRHFPGHLNARAATETAAILQMDKYAFRRQLLAYQIKRNQTPYIFGHYPFSSRVWEGHKNEWAFVTMLRDPVDRWYSEYHWNRYKNHEYAKTELDIEAYLESPQGLENTRSYVNYFTECGDSARPPSHAELEAARGNLHTFTVLGILEDLAGFQSQMRQCFGRKMWIMKRNVNPAKAEHYVRPDRNSAFHKRLLELLAADIDLYKTACEINTNKRLDADKN